MLKEGWGCILVNAHLDAVTQATSIIDVLSWCGLHKEMSRKELELLGSTRESLSNNPLLIQVHANSAWLHD
jgi:hypothetical protein